MGKRIAYTVAGQLFPTQTALNAAVKTALNSHPLDAEFRDDFLAAVINEHHDEVIAAGQRASGRFEYVSFAEQLRRGMPTAERFRGGSIVMAYFEPLGEWRDVTVYPWRKSKDNAVELKRALRDFINERLPRPKETDRCAAEGCSASGAAVEYEHIDPTFDAIALRCVALMSEDEIATRFGYSKFKPGTFTLSDFLPADHPSVTLLLKLHEDNRWCWLCAYHHRNVAAAMPTDAAMAELDGNQAPGF